MYRCQANLERLFRNNSCGLLRQVRRILGGRLSATRFWAFSFGTPVGSPVASRSMTPRGGLGVPRLIPARANAALFATAR